VSHRKPRGKPAAGKRAAKIAASPPVAPRRPVTQAELDRAPELLGRVAAALNDCDRAGIITRLAHGAVITDAGYVFRVAEPNELPVAGETWVVRTRKLTEFPPPEGDDHDS
jgi:hypothetical protein